MVLLTTILAYGDTWPEFFSFFPSFNKASQDRHVLAGIRAGLRYAGEHPPSIRELLARLSRENKQLKAKVGNIDWS
jgi:hypothetical protein